MSEAETTDVDKANTDTTTEGRTAEETLYGDKPKESETAEIEKETTTDVEADKVDEVVDKKEGEADGEVKFDLKLPEETYLDDSVKDEIASIAKEQGLSNDQAQKMLDEQSKAVSDYHDHLGNEFKDQVDSWGDEIKNDKDLGGDNLKQSIQHVKRAVTAFAGEEFLAELDETGYGNHPKLFRMFAKIGSELEAGALVTSNTQSNEPKSFAERFYPPATKEKAN